MGVETISVTECGRMLESGKSFVLVDVRTPGEFSRVHAAGACLMPLDSLDPSAVMARRGQADDPIYVICQSGVRSAKAAARLLEAGVGNVFSVEGGTVGWEKMGLPVVRGTSKVISLERQVRIGAGLLVLLGVVLALVVHIGFLAISSFVGAGLVFAGVTDFCGMAMILARMPWNRGVAK